MKKVNYFTTFFIITLLLLAACGKDDSTEDPINTDLEEDRITTTEILTGGNNGTWRISQARLINGAGSFDISNNFNIKDDEFIFSNSGNLEWRQGNDININATTTQESLLDYYRSPVHSPFVFKTNSSTEITALDDRISFVVINATSITGVITYPGRTTGAELVITIVPKLPEDYQNSPTSGLLFSELVSFEDEDIWGQANVGITGSYADNSLYIANRSGNTLHQTRKLDINTGSFTMHSFDYEDFYTKRTFVINNELIIFGGSNIYTYDLDISADPTIIEHGLGGAGISRFGAASYDDEIYIVGGDLDEIESDLIRKYNTQTGEITLVGNLPGPKTHAGAEIVNNILYVFSGRQQFIDDETVETTSYSYDLLSGETNTFDTTHPMQNSYASRYENLIYVFGDVDIDTNGDGNTDKFDISIGVYNTLDGSYTEIEHNLDDDTPFLTVAAMTVFNGKMYVLYGNAGGGLNIWSVMSADIN